MATAAGSHVWLLWIQGWFSSPLTFPSFLTISPPTHPPPSHHLGCKKGQWEALGTVAAANWVLAPGWAIALRVNPCDQTFLWGQGAHPSTHWDVAFLIQGMGHTQP